MARYTRRQQGVAQVHALAQQGLSQRAITRRTGFHRRTVKRWLREIPPVLETDPLAQPLPDLPTRPTLSAHRQRYLDTLPVIQNLAQQGLSYAAIAKQVGLHRIPVSRWLQGAEGLPSITPLPEVASPVQATPPPPAPWSNWEQIRQVREALHEHRFLFVHRPQHLTSEEQDHVGDLLKSPIGPELQVVLDFMVEWYQLWQDETGQRRSYAVAHQRFLEWRDRPAFMAVPALRRFLQRMTDSHFDHLSQFLRHPDWEATNDAAERAGRAFRHLQAPHFNFRLTATIEAALVVAACQQKARTLNPATRFANACTRGRKPRDLPTVLPAAGVA